MKIKTALPLRLLVTFFITLSMGNYGLAENNSIPNNPSDVYVDQGSNLLMVQKPNAGKPEPFIIKGVNWSPATRSVKKGPNPLKPSEKVDYGFFYDWEGRSPQGHEVLDYWLKEGLSKHYKKDINLMHKMHINTVRIYQILNSDKNTYKKILDEFYKNGIMAILTVGSSKKDLDAKEYLRVVENFKDHPAVLMWAIGNEWNLNMFYDAWGLEDASQAVNLAAQEIKQQDTHHPVSSVLGDKFDDFATILSRCPDVDIWGLNIYRGNSFGNLFTDWKQKWQGLSLLSKPFYLAELGIDSFHTASYRLLSGSSNKAAEVKGEAKEERQADTNLKLFDEILRHLSVLFPDELCLGGLVFEFNDELWKVGNYHVDLGEFITSKKNTSYAAYNKEGLVLNGASADNVLNPEYFGLVDANRKPKKAYQELKEKFAYMDIKGKDIEIRDFAVESLINEKYAFNFSLNAKSKLPVPDKQVKGKVTAQVLKPETLDFVEEIATDVPCNLGENKLTWDIKGKPVADGKYKVKIFVTVSLVNITESIDINIPDVTPPFQPAVSDEGDWVNSEKELSVSWKPVKDADSGVAEYQYAIGTAKGKTDILSWKSAGKKNSVVVKGLNLGYYYNNKKAYYFSVRAKDYAGNLGAAGYSDGIKVNHPPKAKIDYDGIEYGEADGFFCTVFVELDSDSSDPDGKVEHHLWFGKSKYDAEKVGYYTSSSCYSGRMAPVWLKVIDDRGAEATAFKKIPISPCSDGCEKW